MAKLYDPLEILKGVLEEVLKEGSEKGADELYESMQTVMDAERYVLMNPEEME